MGLRKCLFQDPVLCLESWFLSAQTLQPTPQSPAAGPSEAETSWVKILWFCDPRNWFSRYLGNYQWRTSHLPAPWMRMWLEKPLFSHPTLYLVHHPMAQPRITHWDPFLPGILELQLTVLVYSASLRLVPTCASACPRFLHRNTWGCSCSSLPAPLHPSQNPSHFPDLSQSRNFQKVLS